MTAPRHEITWVRTQIQAALHGAGIPLEVSGGVYYGQCMQRMLQNALMQGVDYVLTVDFDSVFTTQHVQRLLSWVVHHDEIDAVCAIQPKRGSGLVLGSNGQKQDVEYTGKPIQIRTGHFGLTVIDVAKLAHVDKPWFAARPNEDGDWDDGKVDDDVHFWHRWHEAGFSLYCDPGCRLGHYEEMVTVFDESMELQHYYPNQWLEGANARAVD